MIDKTPIDVYRVVSIVGNIKQFRHAFYTRLAASLARKRVRLSVLYSDPDPIEALKEDSIDLQPPLGKKIPRIYVGGNRILVQFPPLQDILRADLIIIVQAAGYILNYPLLVLSALKAKRIAFWGHGYNRQGNPQSFPERLKRHLVRVPSWWFAYTNETAHYLESVGVSRDNVTVIENAIDTSGFRHQVDSVRLEEMAALRARLDIGASDPVALYCGSLYKEKRVSFLLEAADRIAARLPGFRLLIIGAGNEANLVGKYAQSHSRVIYLGPDFGHTKVVCFRIAQVFLNPGLVGVGILDCFAAGLPLVTTKDAPHSPEIDYLESGVNGLMLEGDVEHYARTVVGLLQSPFRLAELARGARKAGERYAVDNMVANVSQGILKALKLD